MDPNPEDLLRRLHDRDAEMCALLQRACLLNRRSAVVVDLDHDDDEGTTPATEEIGSRHALEKSLTVLYGCQEKVSSLINDTAVAQAITETTAVQAELRVRSPQIPTSKDVLNSTKRGTSAR